MRAIDEFQTQIGRIEELVHTAESSADPVLRQTVNELIENLMALHGAGLERILEVIATSGTSGGDLTQALAHDELVSSLLVLYGLHPDNFEIRVRRGLDQVRSALRSHGTRLESIVIGEGSVRIKFAGSSSDQAEALVRNALLATAPDATDVIIEGGSKAAAAEARGFVPLTSLRAANGSPIARISVTQP